MTDYKQGILHQNRRNYCRTRLGSGALGICLMLSAPVLATPLAEPSVLLSQTPSELKPYAIALGQRLQLPGKEKISAEGAITYFGEDPPRTEAVRITWQFPLKIRLDKNGSRLAFDGNNPEQAMLRGSEGGRYNPRRCLRIRWKASLLCKKTAFPGAIWVPGSNWKEQRNRIRAWTSS